MVVMSLSHVIMALFGLIFIQAEGALRPSQPLLDKLSVASSEEEAARLEADVWDAWMYEAGPTVDILMERATEAMQFEENELARDLLDRIILIDPDYAEAWHRRATIFYQDGAYDEAIADLEQALRHEPRHFGAWTGLGAIFESIEENDAALAAYRKALAIHPFSLAAKRAEGRLTPIVEGRAL